MEPRKDARDLVEVDLVAGTEVCVESGATGALELLLPEMVWDLPTGARRIMQRAKGYVATFAGGVQTIANDRLTGALPGRLLRGARPAPQARA